ncbi:sodium:proton antiporter [Pedobacter psychrophilus]|uniref:Na(+)/H(+) antiporter NhaA n=1 Tax=Pedobacter psychrophilus TaxID=1826909 RepID=A0A179DFQ2_9SPHI|nr:Na+/H+ antiporter NhaA [Pedobacter psychrophilus]OAQ39885.1 sodium:proton antiporter [Pedobacter psychrophilus]
MREISKNVYKKFLQTESKAGIILIFCVFISILIANSSLGSYFNNLLNLKLGIETGGIDLNFTSLSWINDGLMAIFFLYVGLEIKREVVDGELKSIKQASLPIIAALGGMLVPALLFALVNIGAATSKGWGIPMATDIAFAIGILSVLGDRVPKSLKIFLTALAIVDDLGAILVIAVFYTSDLHFTYLLLAAGVFAFQMALNYFGAKKLIYYIIPGIILWYFIHHSGIHATIAGVLTAIAIPANAEKRKYSPLERLEGLLSNPVSYVIMPLFALANTNIKFESEMLKGLTNPLGLGILAGLFIGKPLGITFASWIAIKLKIAKKPRLATWKQLSGVAMLGGIGFTMSIFVSLLSFASPLFQLEAKFSILIASIISAISGYIFLNYLSKKQAPAIVKEKSKGEKFSGKEKLELSL